MYTVQNYKLCSYTCVSNRVVQQCHW